MPRREPLTELQRLALTEPATEEREGCGTTRSATRISL